MRIARLPVLAPEVTGKEIGLTLEVHPHPNDEPLRTSGTQWGIAGCEKVAHHTVRRIARPLEDAKENEDEVINRTEGMAQDAVAESLAQLRRRAMDPDSL